MKGRGWSTSKPTPRLVPACRLWPNFRARNVTRKRVRIPIDVAPKLREATQARWKLAYTPVTSLAPGERIEVVWILEKPLPPGSYHLEATTHAIIEPNPARFRIDREPAPEPMRLHFACVAARLTGNTASLIAQLTDKASDPLTAPSIHLQLAELHESTGQNSMARQHYEIFAEKTFGMEPIPGWLRAKMDAL